MTATQTAPAQTVLTEAPADEPTPAPLPITPQPVEKAVGRLSQVAILINFSRSGWAAAKVDQDISDEIAAAKDADPEMGHYYRRLLPKEALKGIKNALQAAYVEHLTRTMAWGDSHQRLLGNKGILAYEDAMQRHQERVEAERLALGARYAELVDEAERRAGKMFNRDEYLSAEEVMAKFGFRYRKQTVPDVNDFERLGVSPATVERLQAEYAEDREQAVIQVRQEMAKKVVAVVKRMSERLHGYTGGREGSFKATLVENIEDLADLLPGLNVTGDPAVDELADRLRRDLCSVEPQVLRTDEAVRKTTAEAADAILGEMAEFLN